MDDLIAWLRGVLDEDAAVIGRNRGRDGIGENATYPDYRTNDDKDTDAADDYLGQFPPTRMAAEVEAKRRILNEVMAWEHYHGGDDPYYSCAQAVSPWEDEDQSPGSGCSDDDRRGGPCDCGLDRRQRFILGALALPYADRPGYREEWRP